MSKSNPIRIEGMRDFNCPLGWTIKKAEKRIRDGCGLLNGYITKDEIATDPDDVIEPGAVYRFISFSKLEGISSTYTQI